MSETSGLREFAREELYGCAIVVVVGDLTVQHVDVVVNAANEQLEHGGGVAAALARAGGREVVAESEAWVAEHGPLGPGRTAVTTAGHMPARYLVHVVGPRYTPEQDNEGLLREAVAASLDTASSLGARSVALPMLSAGIFGFPPERAGRIIADECRRWVGTHPEELREIRLVALDESGARYFAAGLDAEPAEQPSRWRTPLLLLLGLGIGFVLALVVVALFGADPVEDPERLAALEERAEEVQAQIDERDERIAELGDEIAAAEQRAADAIDEDLADRQAELDDRASELDDWAGELDGREAALDERAAELDAREAALEDEPEPEPEPTPAPEPEPEPEPENGNGPELPDLPDIDEEQVENIIDRIIEGIRDLFR